MPEWRELIVTAQVQMKLPGSQSYSEAVEYMTAELGLLQKVEVMSVDVRRADGKLEHPARLGGGASRRIRAFRASQAGHGPTEAP
jgi:hypothetical protein